MDKDFLARSNDVGQLGNYPGTRPVEELLRNGIIILDKWPGPTSHDVAAVVKKMFGLGKTGHSGTLDPAVSGVLPIALENACKVIPALQHLDKEYVGIMHLHKDVDDKRLKEVIKKFIGAIKQRPPVRSAVARKVRTRNVYSFEMLDRINNDIAFRVSCEAGTYIRVICHQIGEHIGGAHMKELRRTKVGRFGENITKRIQDIADTYHDYKENGSEAIRDYVLPVEAAVEHLGKIVIKDSAVFSVASGTPVYATGISKVSKEICKGDLVAVITLKGELVALAKANMNTDDMIKKKGLAAKTDRVIMDKSRLAAEKGL